MNVYSSQALGPSKANGEINRKVTDILNSLSDLF